MVMPRIRLKVTKLPKLEKRFIIGFAAISFLLIYFYLSKEPPPPFTIHIKNSNPEAGVQRSTNTYESSQCKIPKLEMNNSQIMAAYI
jgi:hypothetical protein